MWLTSVRAASSPPSPPPPQDRCFLCSFLRVPLVSTCGASALPFFPALVPFPSRADYVDTAIRHVLMRQGMLGVKVQIMLPHDPTGKSGPKKLMGDQVIIKDPKE